VCFGDGNSKTFIQAQAFVMRKLFNTEKIEQRGWKKIVLKNEISARYL
jgi:hypothetical protein